MPQSATVTDLRSSPLSADEIITFYERGFIRAGRILDDDGVTRLQTALDRCREKGRKAGEEYDLIDPTLWPAETKAAQEPGKSVGFLFNLWLHDDDFRQVAFNPLLARMAAQLIGARQVRLLEDGAIYKEPAKGGELKWHQDYPYWPLATPNQVTAWIALDRVTDENGAMRFASGSHLLGERLPAAFGTGVSYLSDKRPPVVKPIGDPKDAGLEVSINELAAGEVSFHHPLTWHASGPNKTDRPRRGFVVRFVGDGAIWLGSRRYEYNYTDDQVGIAIGDPIGGRFFPIVPF